MLVSNRHQPQASGTQNLLPGVEPQAWERWLRSLWTFVPLSLNHGMCSATKEKEPPGVCGCAGMQGGQFVGVDVSAFGSTNIYIHPLCYSNHRFSSKCGGEKKHLLAEPIVSLVGSAVEVSISASLSAYTFRLLRLSQKLHHNAASQTCESFIYSHTWTQIGITINNLNWCDWCGSSS